MKDLDLAKRIQGMEIHRKETSSSLCLTQMRYEEKVLAKSNMLNAKVVNIPLVAHFKLLATLCSTDATANQLMSFIPYAVGNIMYLMVYTRSDITYTVRMMSRYMSRIE